MSTKVEEIVARNFVTGGFKDILALYQDNAKHDEHDDIAYGTEDVLEILIILSSFTKKTIHEIECEINDSATDKDHLKTVDEIEKEGKAKETIKRLEWMLRINNTGSKMFQKEFPKEENEEIVEKFETALKNPVDIID